MHSTDATSWFSSLCAMERPLQPRRHDDHEWRTGSVVFVVFVVVRKGSPTRLVNQGLFIGFGMFGTVGTLSPPCPWNRPWCAGARNGNLSRYALSLTSTPGAKPAAASPATIRLIRTLLTFT